MYLPCSSDCFKGYDSTTIILMLCLVKWTRSNPFFYFVLWQLNILTFEKQQDDEEN